MHAPLANNVQIMCDIILTFFLASWSPTNVSPGAGGSFVPVFAARRAEIPFPEVTQATSPPLPAYTLAVSGPSCTGLWAPALAMLLLPERKAGSERAGSRGGSCGLPVCSTFTGPMVCVRLFRKKGSHLRVLLGSACSPTAFSRSPCTMHLARLTTARCLP